MNTTVLNPNAAKLGGERIAPDGVDFAAGAEIFHVDLRHHRHNGGNHDQPR